jgi:UDP-N-acetylmuramoyl-L-alanyl-D-glutamate--2,6-diaminopimelate ligase
MEVSSHALDQHRVTGVHFKVAGFTNLSQDHLDYHETMEKYFEAKSLLFSQCLERSQARGRMAVVNVDDPKGEAMIEAWGGKSLRVSAEGNREADLWVRDSACSLDGIRMAIETSKGVMELESKLVGAHNLTNVLVAVGMAQAMGFSESRIRAGLEQLTVVPGRMEKVVTEDPRQVFVDYAHTPDALGRVLASLRPLVRGRIIVVFGCGGDRDADKRPAMGRAVAEGADAVVLTSDNPRGEEPAQIAEQAAAGLREGGFRELGPEDRPDRAPDQAFRVELDRWEAIQLAVKWAGPDDVVLVAGKGHETRQELQDRTVPFDDRDAARRTLMGLPPAPEPPPVPGSGEVEVLQVVESVDIEPDIVGETHEEPSKPGGAEP